MNDILKVIKNPSNYSFEDQAGWHANFELTYRQFVDAGWSMEFLATDELRAIAAEMNVELENRYNLLTEQYNQPTPSGVEALTQRMQGPEDKMYDLRTKFTTVARDAVSS